MRYLSKSRFKLAIDCPTKLYYTNKEAVYKNVGIDDPFLRALAEGGFQVGELAKYLFCEDPIAERITIEERDHDKAVALTNLRLRSNNALIAEAAFQFQNLFVRADITLKKGDELHLYEVKSKSWNKEKDFWKTIRKTGETFIDKDWMPYLQDIAFQKWVVQKAFPNYKVFAYLLLADSEMPATIEGLNQLFRIERGDKRSTIKVVDGTVKSKLGTIPLIKLLVDRECDWIWSNPVEVDMEGVFSFEEVIRCFSDAYSADRIIWSTLGTKCRDCEFNYSGFPDQQFKSGFHECWMKLAGFKIEDFNIPMTLELWGGLAGSVSIVGNAIANKKYFLKQLEEKDYFPGNYKPKEGELQSAERRRIQITKAKNGDNTPWLDRKGLELVFDELDPPYHFIDFETSRVALPFHKGRKPYEAIAFQYSYHLMDEKGNIKHQNQFLTLDPAFPNYSFLRALKNDLNGKAGTIFRYHNHENTFLCAIYKQLEEENDRDIPDKKELMSFIECITHKEGAWCGDNDMEDLWKLVLGYYYSPFAKGSNSIKYILPAVINDSKYILEKYSQPIYGTPQIPSYNFSNHRWITAEKNPYHTLPPIIAGYDNDDLEKFAPIFEDIQDGGAAMMAYAFLQFTDVTPQQREAVRNALYRYCELDTMAMVMIWEYWGKEIGFF